jgi:hypothetical protein
MVKPSETNAMAVLTIPEPIPAFAMILIFFGFAPFPAE